LGTLPLAFFLLGGILGLGFTRKTLGAVCFFSGVLGIIGLVVAVASRKKNSGGLFYAGVAVDTITLFWSLMGLMSRL
jgi:hypothetical protein